MPDPDGRRRGWAQAHAEDRARREAAEQLTREQAGIAIENWNVQLRSGGPPRPSPTLALALHAGHRWLQVFCPSCETTSFIDIEAIKRDPRTEIVALARRLACERCRRQGAQARIEGLLRERPGGFYRPLLSSGGSPVS